MLAIYDDAGGTLDISSNCTSVAGCQAEATDGTLWAVFGLDPLDADNEWYSIGSDDVGSALRRVANSKVATVNYALSMLYNGTGYTLVKGGVPCDGLVFCHTWGTTRWTCGLRRHPWRTWTRSWPRS